VLGLIAGQLAHAAEVPQQWDPSPPRAPVAEPERVFLQTNLGALISAGAAPDVAAGGTLELAARWSFLSLGVEGRADIPSSSAVAGGELRTSLILATFVPCFRTDRWGGCALASVGTLEASGPRLTSVGSQGNAFYGLGGRLFYELPLGSGLSLQAHVDLLGAVSHISLWIGGSEVWSMPPIAGSLGLSVGFSLPLRPAPPA
jgi:hypothetical protein